MGAKPQPCYNQIHAINDRVIMRLQCISFLSKPISAPTIWNDLPLKLRQSIYFNGFKTELKTHLFTTC